MEYPTYTSINDMKSNLKILVKSTLTCPKCHHQKVEQMPISACQYFYKCDNCNQLLKPMQGDCCVFCSYGTVPCPSIQARGKSQDRWTL